MMTIREYYADKTCEELDAMERDLRKQAKALLRKANEVSIARVARAAAVMLREAELAKERAIATQRLAR